MFKELGDMANLLKKAQQIRQELDRVQEELKQRVVEGTAGGGMVRVRVNGQQEVVSVEIEREVVDPDDVQMLEDLVKAAATQALTKAKEAAKEEVTKLTGGLNIPGLLP